MVLGLGGAACGARSALNPPVHRVHGDAGADAALAVDSGVPAADATGDALRDATADSDAATADATTQDARDGDADDSQAPPFDALVAPDSALACPDGGFPVAYLLDQNAALYTFSPLTLETQLLGTPDCGSDAGRSSPWTLSVSSTGIAYVLFSNWSLYAVDLTTLECTPTRFRDETPNGGGIYQFGIAVSRTPGEERMFYLGDGASLSGGPTLLYSNLTSFGLHTVGPVLPAPSPDAGLDVYDMQADLDGHLFVYDGTALLQEVDEKTGRVLQADQTGLHLGSSAWAVMTYEDKVYLFSNEQLYRHDFTTHMTLLVGPIQGGVQVEGASAVPCLAAR